MAVENREGFGFYGGAGPKDLCLDWLVFSRIIPRCYFVLVVNYFLG